MGFSIMTQLQHVMKEVEQLKEQQKRSDKELEALRQQSWGADFIIVRAATLDDWAAKRHQSFDDHRISLVHGGKLRADIETIRFFSPSEPGRVELWKSAFKQSYGLLYERLERQSENLPDIFVEVLEKRASVQWLLKWGSRENKDRRSRIITIGNDFIRCFSAKEPFDSPEMVSKFEELRNLWVTGMTR